MCGRFTVTSEQSYLEDRFSAKFVESFSPRFNAAPSQNLPIITNTKRDMIQFYNWGLKPDWWKRMKVKRGDGIINVRMETLRDKWSFKKDLHDHRCLVLADGFYEWAKPDKKPYRIVKQDAEPFAMAGIWQLNTENGKEIKTFSIVTCEANQKLSKIHNRMPVILDQDEEEDWLGDNRKIWIDLLDAYPGKGLNIYPVSSAVNMPTNNSPDLIEEIEVNSI